MKSSRLRSLRTFGAVAALLTTAFTAQQKLASIAGQRMVSSVGLIKALGGGWETAQMNEETGTAAAPAATASSALTSGPVLAKQ